MRNLPAWESQAERLDRTRRKMAAGDARGNFRAASPRPRTGTGGGDVTIITGDSGADIHHVTLQATAGQTIAAGGAGIEWAAPAAGPPTEQRGFPSLTLPVVAIPSNITGLRKWFAHLIFADDVTATVTITRVRDGVGTTIEEYQGTGIQWFDGSSLLIASGDTTRITIAPDVDTTVVWGRIFVDDFGTADATSPQTSQTTVYEQTNGGSGWTSGGDWPDADALWIWTAPDGVRPAESAYVARAFWLPEAATVRAWLSADNTADLYIDGNLVVSKADAGDLNRGNAKATVALAAGNHTVAIRGNNLLTSVAAIRAVLYEHAGGVDTDLLVRTDLDWTGWTSEPSGWPDPTVGG